MLARVWSRRRRLGVHGPNVPARDRRRTRSFRWAHQAGDPIVVPPDRGSGSKEGDAAPSGRLAEDVTKGPVVAAATRRECPDADRTNAS